MRGSIVRKMALALAGVSLTGVAAPLAAQAQAQDARRNFNIPAQGMANALEAFGRQSGRDILFDRGQVSRMRSSAVRGALEPADALRQLVGSTGLSVREPNSATFVVGSGSGEAEAAGAAADSGSANADIVVTGTNIRGSQPSSPTITISQENIRLSGQSNLGETVRALPQNFGGGQNPGVALGAGAVDASNGNNTGGSGVNLRGLGQDSTLVLLNGIRLPYNGPRQATDITAIPVAAVSRVEVLLDGASAIYGSDAIGGIVNIVLRRDFRGAEFSARYGVATRGGYEQTQLSGVVGTTWQQGGILLTGDFSRNTSIRAEDRNYLAGLPRQDVEILPRQTQRSGLLSAHHRLNDIVEVTLDAFFTDRETEQLIQPSATRIATNAPESRTWGIIPGLALSLPADWSLRFRGFLGQDRTTRPQRFFQIPTGAPAGLSRPRWSNKAESVEAIAEGPVASLRSGQIRAAIGGGYRNNHALFENLVTGAVNADASRDSFYGFGEVSIPLVTSGDGIPGVDLFDINGAIRYESYNDFGNVLTPKVGFRWRIVSDVTVRGSWGRSFKTPTLLQTYGDRELYLYPGSLFSGATPANALVLVQNLANNDLDAERAETLSAGLLLQPRVVPGLHIEVNWYRVNYTDRVVQPITPFASALIDPIFSDFVTRNPTIAQQNAAFANANFFLDLTGAGYDPTRVIAIVDNRFVNAARQTARGFDVVVDYGFPAFGGDFTASANLTWLRGDRRLTAQSAPLRTTGTAFLPASFRGRGGLLWSRNGWTLASYLNHVGSVDNTAVNPVERGDSMTTVDAVLDFRGRLAGLGEVGFNISVLNAFDASPPFLRPASVISVNYDSTNYSPIGRVINLTITKRF